MTSEIKSLEKHDYFLFKHHCQQCGDAVFLCRHHLTLTMVADVSWILLCGSAGYGVLCYINGDPFNIVTSKDLTD